MHWTRLKVVAALSLATITGTSMAQDMGEGIENQTITEETRIERTDTGDTANVMGLRWTTKKVEFSVPALETYTFDADTGYLGVDDFFNIREANPNVRAGQWQFEIGSAWSTYRSGFGRDDDFKLTPSIKYGILDTLNVELGMMPINLGDGTRIDGWPDTNDGTGDTSLKLFWQMVQEHDWAPAMALWTEVRFPTGEGSSSIDGTLHINVTKTLLERLRGHLAGFIETANGSRGDFDRFDVGDRRHFQWGVGCGLDYAVNDDNLLVLNYLNRSSEYYGNRNNSIIETGWVYHINENQQLMLGADYADVHGRAEGPRWTGKLQWSIAW